MSFSQLIFIFCFLPLALFLYYMLNGSALFLFAASLVFYACGSPDHILLLLLMSLMNVAVGAGIERLGPPRSRGGGRLPLLVAGIAANVGILFYFKYFRFFAEQLSAILPSPLQATGSGPIPPLGISFFTFRAISLLVDVYRGTVSLQGKSIHALAYLSFFGHIQSGPIARFSDRGWNDRAPALTWDLLSRGIHGFAVGLFKKAVLADSLAAVANSAFSQPPGSLSTGFAWLGAICYALQLYFDFSGYSEMAIGITNMFGFSCGANFDYPYMTRSISEFWRRWHISLGSWFRDYIYIPMGGSRVGSRLRLYLNLLVVWLLTGLWHGASWTFVVWGLAYFALIAVEKTTGLPGRLKHWLPRLLYRLLCVAVILFLWVIFRAPTLRHGLSYIRSMLIPSSTPLMVTRANFLIRDNLAFLIPGVALCFPIVPRLEKALSKRRVPWRIWSVLYAAAVAALFLWSVSFIINGSNNPFLYANF